MENCRSVKLLHDAGRPRLAFRRRPLRVLCHYFLDPDFGLIHVRQETGFPFTVQIYVNGHDWLARQMHQQHLGFVQTDNAFTQLDNPQRAQTLADGFARLKWVDVLDHWVRLDNPLLDEPWLGQRSYRWVVDQAEFSTDVLFDSKASLQQIFPTLLQHAALNFSADELSQDLVATMISAEILDILEDKAWSRRFRFRLSVHGRRRIFKEIPPIARRLRIWTDSIILSNGHP